MKPKTLIMMGIAVVCGLAASVLAHQLLAKNRDTIRVLVAKEKMQQWDVIKDPDVKFKEEEILVNDAPKGAFTVERKEEVKGRTLRKNIEEGDKLTADDLLPKDKNSLESQLTPGKRAWAIKITQDSAVGGFVLPGSHVDVWHISREGGNRGNESKMVLENVLVRAIGMQPVRPEDRPGMIEATATLELSPDEIEELAKVQDVGHLRLSLRASGDISMSGQKLNNKKQEVVAKEVQPPPPPPEAGSDTEKPSEKPLLGGGEPETITKTMTVFNSDKWMQRVYTIDKKTGEVLSSEIRQSDMPKPPEPKTEVKTAPADTKSDKPKEESTN
jgi:pilus assembly protein CpaB